MLDQATTPATAGVEREFRFTPDDFRQIALIIKREAGIALPESKSPLVYARLTKRLRELGLRDFSAYVARLTGPLGGEERPYLVTALTTNVTRFYREPHHFDHLRRVVLPGAIAGGGTRSRVRLWSSACSTGQEPYSIALAIADLLSPAVDAKILATDIDPAVLAHARLGQYDSLDGVPSSLQRQFRREQAGWTVSPELRSLITFRQLNLISAWPVNGPFDAIFCRNVAIYFDQPTQADLWSRFAQVLRPGGVLYIGHSERVFGDASSLFENVGVTTYQRRSDA